MCLRSQAAIPALYWQHCSLGSCHRLKLERHLHDLTFAAYVMRMRDGSALLEYVQTGSVGAETEVQETQCALPGQGDACTAACSATEREMGLANASRMCETAVNRVGVSYPVNWWGPQRPSCRLHQFIQSSTLHACCGDGEVTTSRKSSGPRLRATPLSSATATVSLPARRHPISTSPAERTAFARRQPETPLPLGM